MKIRIHYTLSDGSEDSLVISGNSIEELREVAAAEVSRRYATDPWSEELED